MARVTKTQPVKKVAPSEVLGIKKDTRKKSCSPTLGEEWLWCSLNSLSSLNSLRPLHNITGNKKATREKGGAPPRSWVLKKIPVKKAAPLS